MVMHLQVRTIKLFDLRGERIPVSSQEADADSLRMDAEIVAFDLHRAFEEVIGEQVK